ncbi:hypothetical protein ACWC2T_04375 [Streptomyces sp. NPDC001393]
MAGVHDGGEQSRHGADVARPACAAHEGRAGDGVLEVGGPWIIDVPSEEEALSRAERMPLSDAGRVEVRRCDGPPRHREPARRPS